ncbi:zinc finger matrin-type protein CG9776 isoform X2 [Cylas formicarius]|uniref:zinc finger matrin-type protein CG9776 isoform X2 n=1 Tax=Cylas formicarius TaxID=197179 RepID=UPI00295899FE|nr:zinc finger matrin-type protein CG9776 isoform X2 [Cylas formicarius]XP_060531374.1 zinc finger matrin-type protein CG9776 isoform X2 [Cylas formicarius]XP_060531375.1 zinc finger matrin-type protein CG9776 isoform X2 [Cylas formicarius]
MTEKLFIFLNAIFLISLTFVLFLGVVQEMQQQKAQLTKQREDYVRKASVLRKELEQLRHQKQDLINDGSSDKELKVIVKENEKLQEQIQGKMKAILNVIEMLSSIIKDGQSVENLEAQLNCKDSPLGQGEDEIGIQQSLTPTPHIKKEDVKVEGDKRYSYVYYDTGLHWCRTCDAFPETAKSFLQHLQSKEHRDSARDNEVDNTPWHKLPMEPLLASYDDAPKKRIPIKGLQFFISAPSWYCKLCDVWIGDLHCASHHLKSQAHSQNFENFVDQNPHWEMEWLKDREKALTRKGQQDSSDSDDGKKRRKRKRASQDGASKEKKKKRRSGKKKKRRQSTESSSSSSSSDSTSDDDDDGGGAADKSRSIRVAMRNLPQVKSIMNEDMTKWNVLEKLLQEHRKKEKDPEDALISQWMTVVEPIDKEKTMLDSLKDRMKAKQDLEKAKHAELERQRKEVERREREALERQQREGKEAAERAEKERLRREQEEYQRIMDKERDQVKFKTSSREGAVKRPDDEMEQRERGSHHHHHHQQQRKEESPRRHRRDSESNSSSRSRERARGGSPAPRKSDDKKKPPGPPSYKKLPFIGRMPLFKNKKIEEKPVGKEIKKAEYEPQRKTRFESGNLARAFIPQPDVVCFPVLSSIPPLTIPPPPPSPKVEPEPPAAPTIGAEKKKKHDEDQPMAPPPPPPPKIGMEDTDPDKQSPMSNNSINEDNLYSENGPNMDPNMMGQYYQDYSMMYSEQQYEYQAEEQPPAPPPHSYTMPLEPPPLPPDDDLAMLGICADDMAAQTF